MPATWMVDECRRQSLLYLMHASRAIEPDGRGGVPEPLLTTESASLARIRELARELRSSRVGMESLIVELKRLFPTEESTQTGVPEAPWNFAELVGWWLRAGEALRGWSKDDIDDCGRVVSPRSGGLYPPCWCLSRFSRLHFSFDSWQRSAQTPTGPGPDWRGCGRTRREYRLKLLKWVMLNRRPRPGQPDPARQSQEWLQALKQEFGTALEDAIEMLGSDSGLESGGPPSLATVSEWVPLWHAGQFPGGLVHPVRLPVIQREAERTTVIKGLVVLPPASFICSRMTSGVASGDVASPGWQAARELAAKCWAIGSSADAATVPPPTGVWRRNGDAGTPTLAPDDLDVGLLAAVRLLFAAESSPASRPGTDGSENPDCAAREALLVALALAGFSLQAEPAALTAGSRIIPHAGQAPAEGVRKLTLRVSLSGAGTVPIALDFDVGFRAEAAACGERLLAAIENVDWRIWALEKAPLADDASRRRKALLETIDHRGWEAVKRRALATGVTKGGEAAIARLFEHAHRARLVVGALLDASEDATDRCLGGRLLDDLEELRRVALAEAVSIGEQALDVFFPPRRPDGSVHVGKWLRQRLTEADSAGPGLVWKAHSSAFGTAFEERLDERRRLSVSVSAESAGDRERAFLNSPLPPAGGETDGRSLRTVLAGFQARLIESLWKGTAEALDAELTALRSRFAAAEAVAFHDLIARARAGDSTAAAWLDLLTSEPRFDFRCHPPLGPDRRELMPPSVDAGYLEWTDDPTLPAGADIDVTFAIDAGRARRVLGRGPAEPGSVDDLAGQLVMAAAAAGERLAGPAAACRAATDRWRLFGDAAEHPVTKAGPLLDAILAGQDLPLDLRQAVFAAASRWCAALGHEIVPSEWRAGESLPAELFADLEMLPAFDESVPPGAFMLERFGIRGPHGIPLRGAVSAGPAPPGFGELRNALTALGNAPELGHTAKMADLEKRVNDLARQAATGRLPMVVPNLFDSLWAAAEGVSEPLKTSFEPAKSALLQVLKASCRMVLFEPAKLTDHPSEWVVGPDGKRPAGNRIRKVLRPGIRTLSSSLVRAAIVDTE